MQAWPQGDLKATGNNTSSRRYSEIVEETSVRITITKVQFVLRSTILFSVTIVCECVATQFRYSITRVSFSSRFSRSHFQGLASVMCHMKSLYHTIFSFFASPVCIYGGCLCHCAHTHTLRPVSESSVRGGGGGERGGNACFSISNLCGKWQCAECTRDKAN